MKTRILMIFIILAGITLFVGRSPSVTSQAHLFSHNTRAHKEGKYKDCSSCHSLPTKSWTSARRDQFPDVTTYPSHTSCFGCHTKDIFSRGGAFCGNCHVVPTMRARAVLPFPARSRPSQFMTLFPHNIHQDLIAENRPETIYAPAHFVGASIVPTPLIRDNKTNFYNCAICHATESKVPKYGSRRPVGPKALGEIIPDTFESPVAAAFFKDSPENHSSCFNCHYQYKYLPPGKQSCAGCHEASKPFREREVTERYSLKFNHERVGHVEKDCMSCHLRIAQNNDIRSLKDADVPILACLQCHATQEEQRSKSILSTEIVQREASIAKGERSIFQCTYCHTSAVGRLETPASHRR
jgi:hypothetical protein